MVIIKKVLKLAKLDNKNLADIKRTAYSFIRTKQNKIVPTGNHIAIGHRVPWVRSTALRHYNIRIRW